jgi:dipeptidyl-peptidase-4
VLSTTGKYLSFVRDRRLWTGMVGAEPKPVTPAESADTVH